MSFLRRFCSSWNNGRTGYFDTCSAIRRNPVDRELHLRFCYDRTWGRICDSMGDSSRGFISEWIPTAKSNICGAGHHFGNFQYPFWCAGAQVLSKADIMEQSHPVRSTYSGRPVRIPCCLSLLPIGTSDIHRPDSNSTSHWIDHSLASQDTG